jgi:hypothetical protein
LQALEKSAGEDAEAKDFRGRVRRITKSPAHAVCALQEHCMEILSCHMLKQAVPFAVLEQGSFEISS